MNRIVSSFLEKHFKNIDWGTIKVKFPNDDVRIYTGRNHGLNVELMIRDNSIVQDIFLKGELGFAEGFINKKWDTSDLANLLKFLLKNQQINQGEIKPNFFLKLYERIKFTLKKNSLKQAQKNIEFHYDLGNEFYSKWLDETMSYSSAFYNNKDITLFEAQKNKYKNIVQNLEISIDDKICEIGTGWGGFASELLSKNEASNLTGYTISKNQFNYVQEKLLSKKKNVNFSFLDYRKINQKFDKIVSIEMFEAVGRKYWDTYFDKIYNSLNPGGKVCLQIITINENSFKNYVDNVDFIQKYIFPGGILPSKSILFQLFKRHNLELYHQQDFGHDYAKTLIKWKETFNSNWKDIKSNKFDNRFKRIWNYYLDYCETGFTLNHTDVSQFYLKKVA